MKKNENANLKNYPKITIVTPNYNLGTYLEKTIQSIINQEYPNLEYIIIDGGSTDQSLEIIKKYERYISYWISEPDEGIYHAIQKGFNQSSGEIMGWLNSDDMLHPGALNTIAEIFSNFQNVEWLQGRPTSFDEKSRTFAVGQLRKWSKYHFYLNQYQWIQQESTFWRRNLWNKAGQTLNLNMQFAGDFELWLRFFRHSKLYSTSSLIGGFRHRTTGQVSKERIADYLSEVKQCLKNELSQLPLSEKNKLNRIKIYYFIYRILKKTKIFNSALFEKTILLKQLNCPPLILFNVHNQAFYLSN